MHMFHDTLVSFAERRVISMKCLLVAINSKYIHSNPAVYLLRECALRELEQKQIFGVEVELAEYTINHHASEIFDDIYLHHADLICFSCYIWNIEYVRQLVRNLKNLCPNVKIWVGGPEVSYDCESFLRSLPQVDGILYGEGEKSFPALIEYYAAREKDANPLSETFPDGAAWLDENGVFHQTSPQPLTPMENLPFIYDEAGRMEGFKNRIIYYETSRGCPFSCSYCLSSVDKRLRFRDIELVKKELQFFLDHNVPQVKFVDRTFNCKHDHSIAIWKYIMEHDNGITNFHFEIAADILNEEELELLEQMRPGLVQLEIGVQSTNPKTIKEIHRVMDFEKVSRIVRRIQERGNVHEHLDLIAGLPYEDVESFAHSFDDVYALKPEQLQLGFLKVLKGSFMQEHQKEYGIVHKAHPPYEVLYTKWISYEDVLRLKGVEEMVEVYYNSRQFTNTMEELEKEYDSAFDMYDRLAAYYEENDYNSVQHKRSARYEILLNYVRKYHKEKEDLFREVLTYDYYLRENAKSRPAFAGEYPVTKDAARAFYETEEETHEYLPDYGKYDRNQMRKMTHLEYFKLTDTYILFDYQNRNPLNQEARVCKIEKIKL